MRKMINMAKKRTTKKTDETNKTDETVDTSQYISPKDLVNQAEKGKVEETTEEPAPIKEQEKIEVPYDLSQFETQLEAELAPYKDRTKKSRIYTLFPNKRAVNKVVIR